MTTRLRGTKNDLGEGFQVQRPDHGLLASLIPHSARSGLAVRCGNTRAR